MGDDSWACCCVEMRDDDEVQMWIESQNNRSLVALYVAAPGCMTEQEFLACVRAFLDDFAGREHELFDGIPFADSDLM